MRRILAMGLAAFAGLAGWTNPAGAGLFYTTCQGPAILAVTVRTAPVPETAPHVAPNAATLKVKREKTLRTSGPGKIAELVQSTILPLFNFRHMTQLAVARNWRLASPEQQKALIAEFGTLLIRTYSTALANYRDQVIEYKPLRIAPGETEVTRSEERR